MKRTRGSGPRRSRARLVRSGERVEGARVRPSGVVVRAVLVACFALGATSCGGGPGGAPASATPPAGCYELTPSEPVSDRLAVPAGVRLYEDPLEATGPERVAATLTTAGLEVEYPFDRWRVTEDGIAVYAAALSGARLEVRRSDGGWAGTLSLVTDLAGIEPASTEVRMSAIACGEASA